MLVHGFLSSRAQWMDNIDGLKKKCSPVIVELYGHGRSPAPEDDRHYLPKNYMYQFEKIRKALGCEKWYLCGYSLGAGLTERYAIEYPEKVIAHIFTNSTSGFADAEMSQQYRTGGNQLTKFYQESGMQAVEAIAVHPKNAKKLPGHIKKALLADCNNLNALAVAKTIVHTNGNASVREIVSANTRPGLLVCGQNEQRFLKFREFLSKQMPMLDIVDLDTGHAVNAEDPDGFNQAVCEFIDRHPIQSERVKE